MSEPKIVFAKHKTSGRLHHVSQVERGLSCNYFCVECEKELVAVKGSINQHHFRHHFTSSCPGAAPESALHLTAKQIIAESSTIRIDENEAFVYKNAQVEQNFERLKRQADVKIWDKLDTVWYIEVVVSNALSPEKEKQIQGANVNCLVINLVDEPRDISYKNLQHIVLKSLEHRVVVNRKTSYPVGVSNSLSTSPYWSLGVLALFFTLFMGWKILFSNK